MYVYIYIYIVLKHWSVCPASRDFELSPKVTLILSKIRCSCRIRAP